MALSHPPFFAGSGIVSRMEYFITTIEPWIHAAKKLPAILLLGWFKIILVAIFSSSLLGIEVRRIRRNTRSGVACAPPRAS